jgi:hypothetical protein
MTTPSPTFDLTLTTTIPSTVWSPSIYVSNGTESVGVPVAPTGSKQGTPSPKLQMTSGGIVTVQIVNNPIYNYASFQLTPSSSNTSSPLTTAAGVLSYNHSKGTFDLKIMKTDPPNQTITVKATQNSTLCASCDSCSGSGGHCNEGFGNLCSPSSACVTAASACKSASDCSKLKCTSPKVAVCSNGLCQCQAQEKPYGDECAEDSDCANMSPACTANGYAPTCNTTTKACACTQTTTPTTWEGLPVYAWIIIGTVGGVLVLAMLAFIAGQAARRNRQNAYAAAIMSAQIRKAASQP